MFVSGVFAVAAEPHRYNIRFISIINHSSAEHRVNSIDIKWTFNFGFIIFVIKVNF